MDDETIIEQAIELHTGRAGAMQPTRALCSVDEACGETFAVLRSGDRELARYIVRDDDLQEVARIEVTDEGALEVWTGEGSDFDQARDAMAADLTRVYADHEEVGAVIVDEDGNVVAYVDLCEGEARAA